MLVAAIASSIAFGATYYIWTSKTVSFSVDEPPSVLEFPTSLRFYPSENRTIDVVIANSANINYALSISITLSDAAYQQSYVQVSDYTYTIVPGNNTISAWIVVSKDAPPAQQQLTVNFLRLWNFTTMSNSSSFRNKGNIHGSKLNVY